MMHDLLKNELIIDPLAVGYAGMTHAEAEASLNAPVRTCIVETYANAKTVLSKLGSTPGAVFLDALEATAAGNSAVKWAMTFINSDSGIDVGNAETRAMLDQLAAASVLDSASVATIKALAEKNISRASELGFGEVTEGDVQYARGLS